MTLEKIATMAWERFERRRDLGPISVASWVNAQQQESVSKELPRVLKKGHCVECGGPTSRTWVERCRRCAGMARRKPVP